MKSYTAIPLLAAAAYAQSQADGPNCGIVTNPPLDADYPQGTRAIAVAIVAINGSTVALNQSLNAFDGSLTSIVDLQNSASAVLANIQAGNANVSVIPANDDSDDGQIATFSLTSYVGGLACTVNATADNLINRKQALVNACVGPIVLQNAQQQQQDSLTFEATVKSKLSPSLQDLSDNFVAPINIALSSAVSAFADQTTLPASCQSTSTSSASSTTTPGGNAVDPTLTGTTSTTMGGNGVVSPTGIVGGNGWLPISQSGVNGGAQVTGASGWSAIVQPAPTNGAYPSGGAGGSQYGSNGSNGSTEEDCDEEPVEYEEDCDEEPAEYEEDCDEEDPSGQWQTVAGPSGGSSVKPTGSAASAVSSAGWQAVYSGKPSATNGTTYAKYTGAAVTNVASGMVSAVVAVMAALAWL